MGLLSDKVDYYSGDGADFGSYQFISLSEIIDQFMVVYVGEDKLIPKAKRFDVAFHAQRALRELSFDVFKSCKAEEFTVPARLTMPLPHDYVNYTKVSWVDSAGIKHIIYPRKDTGNPVDYYQNKDGDYKVTIKGTTTASSNLLVLDDDYSDILRIQGLISGPNLANSSYIGDISTTSGITTITMKNSALTAVKNATATGSATYTITHTLTTGVDAPLQKESIIEKTTTSALTAASTSKQISINNTTGLKEGMIVQHPALLGSTIIESVGINEITLSSATITGGVGISISDTIRFVSQDEDSTTWANYKSHNHHDNTGDDDYEDDTYWPYHGRRYGLDPQNSQINGSYYIDCRKGLIHFSSNLNGKTVVLDYLSDSLGTNKEMQVHKFAEEAMYKFIMYGVLSGMRLVDPNRLVLLKREKFAEIRKAKLRLSNIKLEEITQILRGKSKQIKH